MKQLYKTIKQILLDVDNPDMSGEKLIKTVKIDKGQYERLVNDVVSEEIPVLYPAVFIHFTDVHYLVSQNNLGEGRGIMRVRFILNRLNDQEDDFETEIFDYARYINAAIQKAKESPRYGGKGLLADKCSLMYFDMPATSNQLQACWLDYDVNFTEDSGEKYKDWIKRTVVVPTFTNFSDRDGDERPDVVKTVRGNLIKIAKFNDKL